jgi:hypothetical protein
MQRAHSVAEPEDELDLESLGVCNTSNSSSWPSSESVLSGLVHGLDRELTNEQELTSSLLDHVGMLAVLVPLEIRLLCVCMRRAGLMANMPLSASHTGTIH